MTTKIEFIAKLDASFSNYQQLNDNPALSRLDFIGNMIFQFTTDDSVMSALFATKALEVILAITNKTINDYIKDKDNYKWYLFMCNYEWFTDRIVLGTSIRNARWLYSHCVDDLDVSVADAFCEISVSEKDFPAFIEALVEFSGIKSTNANLQKDAHVQG